MSNTPSGLYSIPLDTVCAPSLPSTFPLPPLPPLQSSAGKWDMKQPGITAIAHPISLDMATSHGVFVLDGIEKLVEKYRQSKLW